MFFNISGRTASKLDLSTCIIKFNRELMLMHTIFITISSQPVHFLWPSPPWKISIDFRALGPKQFIAATFWIYLYLNYCIEYQILGHMNQTMREAKRTPYDYLDVQSIQYSTLSSQQIKSCSVLEIDEDWFYENDSPVPGGLFDLRLGMSEPGQKCKTCGESTECIGHFGHIKLEETVLHLGFVDAIASILKCICHRCFRLKRPSLKESRAKMKEIRRVNDPEKRLKLMVKLLENIKKCKEGQEEDLFDKNYKSCGATIPSKICVKNYRICYSNGHSNKQSIFDRRQIKRLLEGFSAYDVQCEAVGFSKTKPIDLLIENLLVAPPQVRPYVMMNGEKKCQDHLSMAYRKIIRLNKRIKGLPPGSDDKSSLVDEIQRIIGSMMIKLKLTGKGEDRKKYKQLFDIKSITERLKGKEGRFRQNLLGKRVNFSARTVISPDPNLELNEVGIPEKVAKNLTYPQKISPLNISRIADLVLQKKVKYLISPPEASLMNEQKIINIGKLEVSSREDVMPYLNYGMIAERILQDGDFVLMNRQPTLHRMSMMAHKVRILPYGTFRINLSVCMPYNADFDGDQMNVHVPQSLEALSELKNIASVPNQIVGPKNGTTSMGFSQDSLLGAYLITSKNVFMNREEIMNLLMKISDSPGFNEQILGNLPIPAILKPEPLWTGKQLISLIMPKQIEIKNFRWKGEEKGLMIRKGEILAGVLQKEHIGPSTNTNNIIHHIWIEKGPEEAELFINNLQKVVYAWLSDLGYSLSASDIVPDPVIAKKKKSEFQNIHDLYYGVLNEFRDKKAINKKNLHQQGKNVFDSFEFVVNQKLNNNLSKIQQVIRNCYSQRTNNIYKIVEAKSKGSETNLAQILFSVGNQNVCGKRCPIGFTKRSLPHFHKDDSSPIARGYVFSSFYEGLRADQFFFHSMGGREGLSDTAIKTSKVGYLQRKIIKSLEDIIVKYDSSVRDSKNNVLQLCYGEDGFSPEFIEKHRCTGAEIPKQTFKQSYKWKDDQLKRVFKYSSSQVNMVKRQYSLLVQNRKMFRKYFCSSLENGGFDYHCPISIQRIIAKIKLNFKEERSEKIGPYEVCQAVQKLILNCSLPGQHYSKHYGKDSVKNAKKRTSKKQQDEFDSLSDDFERQDLDENGFDLKEYLFSAKVKQQESFQIFKMHLRFNLSSKVLCKLHKMSRSSFVQLTSEIKERFFKSLASGGESVGCLASQSIGEPTTQMTLNTFHLAGVSDRNVTLGLPRLEEILNCPQVSSNASLTIFPRKPILETDSHKPQIQEYLLNLLINCFPEMTIGDFISSVKYSFDPSQNSKGPSLSLAFNSNKICSSKVWEQIVEVIRKKGEKRYVIHSVIDYNDVAEKPFDPQIILKVLRPSEQHLKLRPSEQVLKGKTTVMTLLADTQTSIRSTKISGIKGLKEVKLSKLDMNLSEESGCKQFVVFKGTGECLRECLMHAQVNSNKTYSSNIQEIAAVLGIEAARESLLRQFKEVLKPYGITINYKHLSVLVDWMCTRGVLTPVNRFGIQKIKNLSVLTKASFQKTTATLFNAAIFSTRNDIKGASERIIFGQPTECGTHQCELMVDPQKCGKYVTKPDQDRKKIANESLGELGMMTPKCEYSMTLDNSALNRSRISNNGVSPSLQGTRTPYQSLSPMLGFSPSYSPYSTRAVSPGYSHSRKVEADRTMPRYQNPQASPYYSTYLSRTNSPTPLRSHLRNLVEAHKTEENDETKRTERQDQEAKDEDQF